MYEVILKCILAAAVKGVLIYIFYSYYQKYKRPVCEEDDGLKFGANLFMKRVIPFMGLVICGIMMVGSFYFLFIKDANMTQRFTAVSVTLAMMVVYYNATKQLLVTYYVSRDGILTIDGFKHRKTYRLSELSISRERNDGLWVRDDWGKEFLIPRIFNGFEILKKCIEEKRYPAIA